MHPPPFRLDHRLLDWPDCRLELQCCKGTVLAPVRLLAAQNGNVTFGTVLTRLRCAKCHGKPRAVWLCAGHRLTTGGPPPDWAIELVTPCR